MIQKYGAHKRTIDTELSENFHKITVKSNFEGTNKNESQVHKQMLINMLRSSHCKNLLGYSKTVHRHDVDNENDIDNLVYFSVPTNGHNILHNEGNEVKVLASRGTNKINLKPQYSSSSSAINNHVANLKSWWGSSKNRYS